MMGRLKRGQVVNKRRRMTPPLPSGSTGSCRSTSGPRANYTRQFLAEAIFLSVSGGIVGVIIGAAFSLAIAALTGVASTHSAYCDRGWLPVFGRG